MKGGWAAALAGAALLWSAGAVAAEGPVVVGPTGSHVALSVDRLAAMPATRLRVSFQTEHGTRNAAFSGPLLWDVLTRAGSIDAAKPRGTTRDVVVVTGSDGYVAALAVGEISPEFEGKQVILADTMNGKPLSPGHLRVVVPGDRRGGRSVRDVVQIAVVTVGPQRR